MKKVIFLIGAVQLTLSAAFYSPMIKKQADTKIIDIGKRSNQSQEDTVSMIWAEYSGILNTLNIIDTTRRVLSDRKACLIDEHGAQGCPLEARECDVNYEYSNGDAELISSSVTVSSSCPVGTRYSAEIEQCHAPIKCDEGFTFSPSDWKCKSNTPQKLTKGPFDYNGACYINDELTRGAACASSNVLKFECKDGNLVAYNPDPNVNFGLTWNNYKGEETYYSTVDEYDNVYLGFFWINWYYGQYPSCVEYEYRDAICPNGTQVGKPGSVYECAGATSCPAGMTKQSATQCVQNYSYYRYSCQDNTNQYGLQWETPVDTGEDCQGYCDGARTEGCVCNSSTPPEANCRRAEPSCPLDPFVQCVDNSATISRKKKLQYHDISGDGLAVEAFGDYVESECGENCPNGVREITADREIVCLKKGSEQSTCVKVDGCEFSGKIDAGAKNITSLMVSGNSIFAFDANGERIGGSISSSCVLNGSVGFNKRKEPIASMVVNQDRLKFWNPYAKEGYLGFIEFVRNVYEDDAHNGYEIDNNLPWRIKEAGFNRIEHYKNITYAISKESMTDAQCQLKASEFGFAKMEPIASIPLDDRMSYDIVQNATGGNYNGAGTNQNKYCVLVKGGTVADYTIAKKAVKISQREASLPEYFCSPLTCDEVDSCQAANCADGYSGDLFSNTREAAAPYDCTENSCDANLPYYEWCGKSMGCPTDMPGVVQTNDGCFQVECQDGGQDQTTGKCYKWKCPKGYIKSGAECVKN